MYKAITDKNYEKLEKLSLIIGNFDILLSKFESDEIQDPNIQLNLLRDVAKVLVRTSKEWPDVTTYEWGPGPSEVKYPIWVWGYDATFWERLESGIIYSGSLFVLGDEEKPTVPDRRDSFTVRIDYWPRDNENGPRIYKVATFWNTEENRGRVGFFGAYIDRYVKAWGGFKIIKVFAENRWDALAKAEILRIAMETPPAATVTEAECLGPQAHRGHTMSHCADS